VVVDDQDRLSWLHGSSLAPRSAAGIGADPEHFSGLARTGIQGAARFAAPPEFLTSAVPGISRPGSERKDADMNRTGRWVPRARQLLSSTAVLAATGLAVAGCGGGGTPAVNPPPASTHTTAEQAAVTHWLVQTNQMWADDDFAAVDQVTTGQMRTIYLAEEAQASLPKNADRIGFQLAGLSITIPCHAGRPAVFVAYADTNVFDLGASMQSVAMVFEQAGGRWKLATAVDHPDGGGWPALCTQGTPPASPAGLAAGSYAPDLARVLTNADTGTAQTTSTAAPFAVNDFLAGSGSIPVTSATSIRQDRRDGVSLTGRFTPTPDPTVALPLADGRGYWLIGILTQSDTYSAPSGLRAKDWPDGNQVATPRPAVVHHESDTFITTYTAIDPPRTADAAVALDGFFGWPLSAVAS
jgi:hypothetical protein